MPTTYKTIVFTTKSYQVQPRIISSWVLTSNIRCLQNVFNSRCLAQHNNSSLRFLEFFQFKDSVQIWICTQIVHRGIQCCQVGIQHHIAFILTIIKPKDFYGAPATSVIDIWPHSSSSQSRHHVCLQDCSLTLRHTCNTNKQGHNNRSVGFCVCVCDNLKIKIKQKN